MGNALIRKPSFVVIDEPETHLHPGLQAEFLTRLAAYSEHGVLFATHSLGLARSSAERCFSVRKRDGASVVKAFERTPHYAEFLGSLGIAGLQDLGWDSVLLVEGPTDVRTFQHFLRLYGKDRKTILLPLGGDSMVNRSTEHELSEIRRLGSKVFAIVDSERVSADAKPSKARTAFAKVCAGLSIPCCVTERRATENYLTQKAVDEAFGARYRALDAYEKPSSAGTFWGKSENWRIALAMSKAELDSTDLGVFLSNL